MCDGVGATVVSGLCGDGIWAPATLSACLWPQRRARAPPRHSPRPATRRRPLKPHRGPRGRPRARADPAARRRADILRRAPSPTRPCPPPRATTSLDAPMQSPDPTPIRRTPSGGGLPAPAGDAAAADAGAMAPRLERVLFALQPPAQQRPMGWSPPASARAVARVLPFAQAPRAPPPDETVRGEGRTRRRFGSPPCIAPDGSGAGRPMARRTRASIRGPPRPGRRCSNEKRAESPPSHPPPPPRTRPNLRAVGISTSRPAPWRAGAGSGARRRLRPHARGVRRNRRRRALGRPRRCALLSARSAPERDASRAKRGAERQRRARPASAARARATAPPARSRTPLSLWLSASPTARPQPWRGRDSGRDRPSPHQPPLPSPRPRPADRGAVEPPDPYQGPVPHIPCVPTCLSSAGLRPCARTHPFFSLCGSHRARPDPRCRAVGRAPSLYCRHVRPINDRRRSWGVGRSGRAQVALSLLAARPPLLSTTMLRQATRRAADGLVAAGAARGLAAGAGGGGGAPKQQGARAAFGWGRVARPSGARPRSGAGGAAARRARGAHRPPSPPPPPADTKVVSPSFSQRDEPKDMASGEREGAGGAPASCGPAAALDARPSHALLPPLQSSTSRPRPCS